MCKTADLNGRGGRAGAVMDLNFRAKEGHLWRREMTDFEKPVPEILLFLQ